MFPRIVHERLTACSIFICCLCVWVLRLLLLRSFDRLFSPNTRPIKVHYTRYIQPISRCSVVLCLVWLAALIGFMHTTPDNGNKLNWFSICKHRTQAQTYTHTHAIEATAAAYSRHKCTYIISNHNKMPFRRCMVRLLPNKYPLLSSAKQKQT